MALGSQFNNTNVTAIRTTENGKTIYRIYSPSIGTGIVSYISEDSLNFTLEGRIPAPETDPRAMVLPDGRIWFCIDPDGVLETLVFGPQPFTVNSIRADVGRSPKSGFSQPFQSAVSECDRDIRNAGQLFRCNRRWRVRPAVPATILFVLASGRQSIAFHSREL